MDLDCKLEGLKSGEKQKRFASESRQMRAMISETGKKLDIA